MHRSSKRLAPSIPALMGLSLLLAAGCLGREGLGDPDGGDTGSAGSGASGHAGTTGSAGTGTTGSAGTGIMTGSAGTTGAAGTGATGKAGTTGSAGTGVMTGSAGTTGAAGTGGKAGTGGTMCGPVCAIFCPYGNVVDASGCPTCKCNPAPVCKADECGPQARVAPPICGGKPSPQTCSRDPMTGKCAWTTPMCACDAIACPDVACPYGNKIDPKSGCQTCECNPAPAACSKDQCGALPPVEYPMKCADGTVVTPACVGTAGMCYWSFPKCPPPVCPAIACLRACPNGSRPDANGCPTCDCIEPKTCGALTDWKSCAADTRCTWMQPGCGSPSLSTPGCYSRSDVGCMTDADCSSGRTCLKRVVDPCFNPLGGASCDACGQVQTICL